MTKSSQSFCHFRRIEKSIYTYNVCPALQACTGGGMRHLLNTSTKSSDDRNPGCEAIAASAQYRSGRSLLPASPGSASAFRAGFLPAGSKQVRRLRSCSLDQAVPAATAAAARGNRRLRLQDTLLVQPALTPEIGLERPNLAPKSLARRTRLRRQL